ncbi:hypothetical protein AAVH_18151 [Aphelenchoides avenae]|nr:hypothetical protein AAVH_18151 [Aphelenchus avenae]
MNYNANGAPTRGYAPPTGHAPHHPDRFKTDLCNGYTENGVCAYNEKCQFAHGVAELRRPASFDPLYKREKCNEFYKNERCSFGALCEYLHNETPEQLDAVRSGASLSEAGIGKLLVPPTSVPYNQKISLCKNYMADGKCQCGFAHGVPELRNHLKYKKKPCLDFQENGRCPFNLLCAYLHDETPEQLDELRAGKTFFEAGVSKLQIDRDGRARIRVPK